MPIHDHDQLSAPLSDEEIVERLRDNERRIWRRVPVAVAVAAMPIPPIALVGGFFAMHGVQNAQIGPGKAAILVAVCVVWSLGGCMAVLLWGQKRLPLGAFKRVGVRARMVDDTERTRRRTVMVQIFVLTLCAAMATGARSLKQPNAGFMFGVLCGFALLYVVIFARLRAKGPMGEDELHSAMRDRALRQAFPISLAALVGLAVTGTFDPGLLWWAAPVAIWLAAVAPLAAFVWSWRTEKDG